MKNALCWASSIGQTSLVCQGGIGHNIGGLWGSPGAGLVNVTKGRVNEKAKSGELLLCILEREESSNKNSKNRARLIQRSF
jgi:hypothetical protein